MNTYVTASPAGTVQDTQKIAQKGSVMAEYGLYLVIAALALVGIITYFSTNSTNTQAQQLTTDLTTLIGNVKANYANNYSAVSNTDLSSGGFFKNLPSLNNASGTVTTNIGGGTLVVAPGTLSVANDSVKYTLNNIPDAACLPLVNSIGKAAGSVKIGSNDVKVVGGKVDPAKVQCNGDANTMEIQVF